MFCSYFGWMFLVIDEGLMQHFGHNAVQIVDVAEVKYFVLKLFVFL
jgi:hypothetical protein